MPRTVCLFFGFLLTFTTVPCIGAPVLQTPGPNLVEFLSASGLWAGGNGPLLLGSLTFVIICGVGWVAALKRQVRRQTAAIYEEKNLLATLIDHLPDNVYVKDDEGRYVLTNQAHTRFHCAPSPGHFRGKPGAHFFPPEVALAYEQTDAKVLHGQVPLLTCEEEVVDGQGRVRFLATTKVPLRNPAGMIIGLVGFSRDITEAKAAERELREKERTLSTLMSNLPGLAYRCRNDRSRTMEFLSEGCSELTGYAPAELLGNATRSYADIIHPADRERVWTEVQQALKQRERYQLTYRIVTRQGAERTVLEQGLGVFLASGELKGLEGFVSDVSERRRVESVLAYERDLLSALFDNLPDALYFKDLQSQFVRVSKSKLESSWAMAVARHKFALAGENQPQGLSCPNTTGAAESPLPSHLASLDAFAEHIIGKSDFDFFSEARARSAFDDEQEIIRTGKPLVGKVEQTDHLDGRVTWSLSTKMPWYDSGGRIIGTFGVSKDITAIKEAEASIALVHKQLLEASRQAGMAEVATGVLHNVGNVLNSVNVSVTLLAEKILHSRAANLSKVTALLREHSSRLGEFMTQDPRGLQLPHYLEQLAARLTSEQASLLGEVDCLAKSVEHIKNIVAMQQAYAKPAGVVESVEPVELVEDALRINASALARHHVEIVREYEPHLPKIVMDKHKVLQILVNLISNAGHACAQSSASDKRVTVRLANTPQSVRISVQDNGVGIAPENLTRVFNLGFSTRPDGHGFGLHSGALAARELGGTLISQSDGPELGAIFTLELPVTMQLNR